MRYREIAEGKWWDNEPTITLYHGTSSAFVEHIREHGLRAPKDDLLEYALDVLAEYIPRGEWTDALVKHVKEHAARIEMGRAGDRGAVIYCFTEAQAVEGYARSYAKHGGEIAYDVYNAACQFRSPEDISWRELKENPPFPPRYHDAKPVVVGIEVPKSWCHFSIDPEHMKTRLQQAWDEGKKWAREEGSIEALYDSVYDEREVRVGQSVPVSMVRSITEISAEELHEKVEMISWPTTRPDLKTWKNPSMQEVMAALESSRHQCLRGLVDVHSDTLYVWDAYMATHGEVCQMVGIAYDYEDENYIFVLGREANSVVQQSDWTQGEVYRTEKGGFYVMVPDEYILRSRRIGSLFGKLFFVGSMDDN
jgi:hypothetical protein